MNDRASLRRWHQERRWLARRTWRKWGGEGRIMMKDSEGRGDFRNTWTGTGVRRGYSRGLVRGWVPGGDGEGRWFLSAGERQQG